MSRQTRRTMLAAVGTTVLSALSGCSGLDPFSDKTDVEYDESAIAALPGDLPAVPPAMPVQPTDAHLTNARDRIRSLLDDTDISQIPNAVVREELARERESARSALSSDDNGENQVEALEGLTHPRSEAMFANAGFAAFVDSLTTEDVNNRRERHHQGAESFLADYSYVGPPDDPVGAFAEHARITDWGYTGARLTEPEQFDEYENTVLHVAELAQSVEWGRAYATDARRLHEHYTSTLDNPRDYEEHFASVAAPLVEDIASYATQPDLDSLTSGIERDISNTPAAKLLEELVRSRWIGAQDAVEHLNDGHDVGAIVPAMRAMIADRAFSEVKDAVSDGAYGVPESVDAIAAERAVAVDGLRVLLNTSPELLARRLAIYVRNPIRNADRTIDERNVPVDGADLYVEYTVASRFAAAAPAVVQRVGDMFIA